MGAKLNNPYAVDVIKQAYYNLYHVAITGLHPTHLYVRYLPTTPQELSLLDFNNREFWDFPLDYSITHMGAYYHDPTVSDTTFTWFYTVVPYGFQFPQVQHEILEQLVEVPYETNLLKEAYRLTGNLWDEPDAYITPMPTYNNGTLSFFITPPGDDGGGGGGGGGGQTGTCGCPFPDNVRKPSGCVTVFDNMLNNWDPVRKVKVITANGDLGLFFTHSAQTSDNGCWSVSHKYYGKIHVWVKFENDDCTIKTMKGQVDFLGYSIARKAYKGTFGGPYFNNIQIQFDRSTAIGSPDCLNWLAALDNNALFEYKGWCGANGIPLPPGDLEILVAPWQDGSGATVMLNHMPGFLITIAALGGGTVLKILSGVGGPISLAVEPFIVQWLTAFAPDVVLNVNNPIHLNADQVKEVAYHEFGHTSHWQSVGSAYWQANIAYVAEVIVTQANNAPYGSGTLSGAGRCAVIESWGFHVGATVSDLHYGIHSSPYRIQQPTGIFFDPTATQSSYIRALEAYDPNLTGDVDRWIPCGIYNDLIDTGIETTPVQDNTSGFTEGQIFSCLNTTSIGGVKNQIQALTGNTQQTAVTNLFTSYGYP